MVQSNKFCTNCGSFLDPAWRFCGSCGQPLAAGNVSGSTPSTPYPATPQPPVFNPPATPGEKLLGVVPAVSRKKGIMAVEGFNVIVTDTRLIFALMTNEMIKEEVQRASKGGAGFFSGIAAAVTAGSTFYKRYLIMSPDAALAENPDNFAVNLSSIRRVKIEAGKELKTYQSMKANQGSIIKRYDYENGKFELETGSETLKFELPGSSLDMAVDAMKKAGLYR